MRLKAKVSNMFPVFILPQLYLNFTSAQSLIGAYGYLGIFGLMTLEGASLPIPSEIVIPVAGYLAEKGVLNLYLAMLAVLGGNMLGAIIDYAIGYFLGKDVVYKHLRLFHIKKSSIDAFDEWFQRNGDIAVFVSRMVPVLRGLISFPAGFARMNFGKFVVFSLAGSAIWDILLILFGYYLLSSKNISVVTASVAVLLVILYVAYHKTIKKNKYKPQ